MQSEIRVRRAVVADAAALRTLRLRALREHPEAFLVSEAEEARRSVEDFASLIAGRWAVPDEMMFVAEGADDLVGMTGFFRDRHEKSLHRVTIWGVYAVPEMRGRGVGRALMEEAIARIRGVDNVTHVHLAVGTYNTPAKSLYEAVGFRTWGVEPATMCVAGSEVDEAHMVLVL